MKFLELSCVIILKLLSHYQGKHPITNHFSHTENGKILKFLEGYEKFCCKLYLCIKEGTPCDKPEGDY